MFAKIRWVCKVQSLGKHKNGWVKKKYSLGSGETKFPLGRGKKSTGSGSTGSVTEGCYHAHANMAARIRNAAWKEDIDLKESLTKHIKEGL